MVSCACTILFEICRLAAVMPLRDRTDLSKQTIICLKYYLELQQPIPRALVAEVEAQVSEVGRKVDERLDAIACGSYRRRKESSHDIDIMLILRGGDGTACRLERSHR